MSQKPSPYLYDVIYEQPLSRNVFLVCQEQSLYIELTWSIKQNTHNKMLITYFHFHLMFLHKLWASKQIITLVDHNIFPK